MDDFFFGSIKCDGTNSTIELDELISKSQLVSDEYFTKQLNRLLHSIESRLVVKDGHSCPKFHSLLSKIRADTIGMVEIKRIPINNEIVKTYVSCLVYLDAGVLDVQAYWTTYKEERAEEILRTLLSPLNECSLLSKTYLRQTDGTISPIAKDLDQAYRELRALK